MDDDKRDEGVPTISLPDRRVNVTPGGDGLIDGELLPPKTMLGDRYQIVRFVARGGMGEVYEAVDTELRTTLAVKTVRSHLAGDAAAMERVRREVQLARVVTHPNVCRLFDLGHADVNGRHVTFITMELLSGLSLAERLSARTALSPEDALPLAIDILAGLDACHRAGVIHRDLKAENIQLVRRDERECAVLTDFGIARASREDEQISATVTQAGTLVGSLAFMAPDLINGGRPSEKTDLYSLGIILWEMVVGPWPLRDKDALEIMRTLSRETPLSSTLPTTLDPIWAAVITRCLGPPEKRYANVVELMSELAPGVVIPRRTTDSQLRIDLPPLSISAPALKGRTPSRLKQPLVVAAIFASLGVVTALLWPRPPVAAASPNTSKALSPVEAVEERLLKLSYQDARATAGALGDTAEGLYLQARAEVGLGHWDQAAVLATQARARGTPQRKAQVFFDYIDRRIAGNLESAIALLEGISRSAPDDVALALDYADELIALGRPKDATVIVDALAAKALSRAGRARLANTRVSLQYSVLDYPALEKATDEAIADARATKAPVIEGRALAYRALALSLLGKVDQSTAASEQALALLTPLDDAEGLAVAYRVKAIIAMNVEGNPKKAIELNESSLKFADRMKSDTLLALSFNLAGAALTDLGRSAEAITAFRESEKAAVRGLREDIANTRPRPNLAVVLGNTGRYDEALATYMTVIERRGTPARDVEEITLTEVYLHKGDLAAARKHCESAQRIVTDEKTDNSLDGLEANWATIAYVEGDDAQYALHAAKAEAAAAANGAGSASLSVNRMKMRTWVEKPVLENAKKLQDVAAAETMEGEARALAKLMAASVLAVNGRRDDATKLRAEATANPEFRVYLEMKLYDGLLGAQLAQTPAERVAAARELMSVREEAVKFGDTIVTWDADLGLAALAKRDGRPADVARLVKSVQAAATAAGYKRYAMRAAALIK